jgi:hypothetical protein
MCQKETIFLVNINTIVKILNNLKKEVNKASNVINLLWPCQ